MFLVMLRIAAVLSLVLAAATVHAAELPGRYVLEKVPEGYLRLDSATGVVSLCSSKEGVWRCEGVPDDMAALANENERLKKRVEELEKSRFAVQLPSDQDVDKLLDLFGKMVDKFIDLSRRLDSQGTI
jgi:hypothetical protein